MTFQTKLIYLIPIYAFSVIQYGNFDEKKSILIYYSIHDEILFLPVGFA